jgi:tRNA(Ile)-lysidine synthase
VRKKRLHPYAAAVLDTLRRRRLAGPGDRVLVALSAGPDSTALLAALAEIRDAGAIRGLELSALHVDHRLRAGGDEDAAAAAGSCARLRVPLETVAVEVGPGNVQAAARRARYAALRAAARRAGATRIATGHTRTDQAETVLLRLLRGAGARGLSAIPPRRGDIVRPLLDRSREEGIRYLADRALAWRADPTNATPRFARNRLRLEVWPALVALAPSAERALARTADLARDDERALARAARALVSDGASVAVAALREMPVAVRTRVVRRLWRSAGGRRGDLGADDVAAILALLRSGAPRRKALPGGLEARARYGTLEIVRPAAAAAPVPAVEIPGPGRYVVPRREVVVEVSAARPDDVPWPMVLRTREPGDRFRPAGGAGSKKLKSWLIDRKVPRESRDALLVVCAGGRVVALPELGVVAQGLGPEGAGLEVRLASTR